MTRTVSKSPFAGDNTWRGRYLVLQVSSRVNSDCGATIPQVPIEDEFEEDPETRGKYYKEEERY